MTRFLSSRARLLSFSALALGASMSGAAYAHPNAEVSTLSKLPSGEDVKAVTLTNDHGMKVKILSYGGIIQSVEVPDRNGKLGNVTLGFATPEEYVAQNSGPHFGAILGRVANRIGKGTFSLNGKTYHTTINVPPYTLHGGVDSFSRKVWDVERVGHDRSGAYVTLRLVSPDGDQGFPGKLTTRATYRLTSDDSLSLSFKAKTTAPTVVNLSTHNYWNLNGEGSGTTEPEVVQIFADRYIETDGKSIPTGRIVPVDNSPYDFRMPHTVGERLRSSDPQMVAPLGYDKCLVLQGETTSKEMRLAARVHDPRSGRVMEVSTNQPGLQFYSSNSIDGSYVGSSGKTYRQGDALAIEPEHFPDSPNRPEFPSIELKPGQTYDYAMNFHFSHD